VQELLADELALLAGDTHEIDDLRRDALLLLEGERHRSDCIRERRLGLGDAGDLDRCVGVEEVLDHHHRVVPLFDRLAVEVRRELPQAPVVVVDRDRDVLLGGRELVADLLVEA
jgi:hypothetical protein